MKIDWLSALLYAGLTIFGIVITCLAIRFAIVGAQRFVEMLIMQLK